MKTVPEVSMSYSRADLEKSISSRFEVTYLVDDGNAVDVIHLDFRNAFDTEPKNMSRNFENIC